MAPVRKTPLVVLLWILIAPLTALHAQDAKKALSLIDYISRDYEMAVDGEGNIISTDEYEEMKQFSQAIIDSTATLASPPPELKTKLQDLLEGIHQHSPKQTVQTLARAIRQEWIQYYKIPVIPAVKPDLLMGAKIYASACFHCHGENGVPPSEKARAFTPPPTAFADPENLQGISPFQAFNTITYGVSGTAMPEFPSLSEQERWAVAAYLFTLRKGGTPVFQHASLPSWQESLAQTDAQLEEKAIRLGLSDDLSRSAFVASARFFQSDSSPAVASVSSSSQLQRRLSDAITDFDRSVALAKEGKYAEAKSLSLSSYLDHFEPIETVLRQSGRSQAVLEFEQALLKYRNSLAQKSAESVQLGGQLLHALNSIKNVSAEQSSWNKGAIFSSAYFILFREGVEALLLVALILACLRSLNLTHFNRYVHFSWVISLIAGFFTWLMADKILSQMAREGLEGLIGIFTAGVLIYVSFWLLSKRDSAAWQEYLMKKLKSGKTGILSLCFVSFLAVYREVVETILFLQALKLEAGPMTSWMWGGLFTAIGCLMAVAWLIFYLRKRLPLNHFFSVTGHILYAIAVVFVGKAIASLGETGLIRQTPVGNFRVEALGIYPIWESLLAQAGLTVLYMIALVSLRKKSNATETKNHQAA